jgi:hypothetical protein
VSAGVPCDDEEGVRAAIASVRTVDGPNWVLVSYAAGAKPDKLHLVGTGKVSVELRRLLCACGGFVYRLC